MTKRDRDEGERRKEKGMDTARYGGDDDYASAKDEWWKYAVLKSEIYLERLDPGDLFTGDDIRVEVGHEPPTPKLWGPLMRYLAAGLGLIEQTGNFVKSELPLNNASRAIVWRRL